MFCTPIVIYARATLSSLFQKFAVIQRPAVGITMKLASGTTIDSHSIVYEKHPNIG